MLAPARHPAAQPDPLADVRGPQLAAHDGSACSSAVTGRPPSVVVGSIIGDAAGPRSLRPTADVTARPASPPLVAQRAQRDHAGGQLLGARRSAASRAPGAVRLLQLGLERAAIVGPQRPRGRPGAARRTRSRACSPPVTSTTKASGRGGSTAKQPSASQASSSRSMPMPKPMPGVGGPPMASDQPVVAAAAAHGVLGRVERQRRRIRRWCGCSSRGHAPGGARAGRRCRARRGRLAPGRSGRRRPRRGSRSMRGAPSVTARHCGPLAVEDPQRVDARSAPGARRTARRACSSR